MAFIRKNPAAVKRRSSTRLAKRLFLIAIASTPLLAAGFAALAWRAGTARAQGAAAAAAPAASAAPAGQVERRPGKAYTEQIPGTTVKFDLMPIPAGTFKMGSLPTEKKRKNDEGPQFEVEIEPFWMDKYEVTWDQYNLFLQNYHRLAKVAQAVQIPQDKLADVVTFPTPMYELDAGPELDRMGRGDKSPAVIMSQLAAKQFTKWLSKKTGRFYRLPSEAEWEYACRAGTTTAYSFGDDPKQLTEYGWYYDNSNEPNGGDPGYHEVGQKKPNPWGLYDMHGNVAEWCIDQYAADWYKHFDGKTVKWTDAINWPKTRYPRSIRGGSWNSEVDECRSAARYGSNAKLNLRDPQIPKSPHWLTEGFWIGFRVIAPVKEPSDAEKSRWWDVDDENTRDVLKRDREMKELVQPGATPETPSKPDVNKADVKKGDVNKVDVNKVDVNKAPKP